MRNQDESLHTSELGLLILILAVIWFWIILR